MILDPEIETRRWEEQLAVDGESYRTQLEYLFERSAFYREKLGDAGIDSAGRPEASTRSRACRSPRSGSSRRR